MSDEEVESFLRNFDSRVGRIRGTTLESKIEGLVRRYVKTAADCRKECEAGFDMSNYRSAYASAHENAAELLSSEDLTLAQAILRISEMLVSEIEEQTPASSGYMDAYGYILAEIRRALEESDV